MSQSRDKDMKSEQSFEALTQPAIKKIGLKGMLQYHFIDKISADNFLAWTREQKDIENLNKANIQESKNQEEKTVYIIRLTQEQENALKKLKPKELKESKSPEIRVIISKDKIDACAHQLQNDTLTPEQYMQVITSFDSDMISAALVVVPADHWTGLAVAARYQPGAAFQALIAKASSDAISQALVVRTQNQWTGLALAARFQLGAVFQALIAIASSDAINQALVVPNQDQWTGLALAARIQPGAAFQALIAKASGDAISQALVVPNKDDQSTGLHQAARHQPGAAFQALIAKASGDAINQALVVPNHEQWTGLAIAARHQPGAAFQALIAKASGDAISQALVVPATDQWTGLHTAARYQPGAAFQALIAKASSDAISQALVVPNKYGDTGLHNIVYYQPEAAVKDVIHKASMDALSRACLVLNKQNQSVLECALPYLPAPIIADLLNKIDDKALHFMVTHKMQSPRLVSSVISNIIFEPSWQQEPLLGRLSKILYKEMILLCCEAWLQGQMLSPAVIKALTPYLQKTIQELKQSRTRTETQISELEKVIAIWSSSDLDRKQDHKQDEKDEKNVITTQSGNKIPITSADEKQLRQLYKEGLQSPHEFRRMQQLSPNGIATQMAEDMRRAGRLYTGTGIDLDVKAYQERSLDYLAIARTGNAVFKIIKEEYKDEKGQKKNDWEGFLKQLRDYKHRPKLRKEVVKSGFTHKFHHRTGKLIDYKEHKPAEKKKDYIATKKQSATLLSRNFNTTVFGEHVAGRMLVGILADISCHVRITAAMPEKKDLKPNEYILTDEKEGGLFYIGDDKKPHRMHVKALDDAIKLLPKPLSTLSEKEKEPIKKIIADYHDQRINKALLSRDKGTYNREWVGGKEDVEKHADEMKDISFTDFTKFREETEKYPYRLNEVQTKFTRNSILGILVVSDTMEARKLAMSRQQDIKKEFNIDLPIIFYDKSLRKMREYSVREQKDDLTGRNSILEEEYKKPLLDIQRQIKQKAQWDHGFFGGGYKKVPPIEIRKILELISKAEKNKSYSEAYIKVKKALNEYKEKSTERPNDVQKISETLFKQMKL